MFAAKLQGSSLLPIHVEQLLNARAHQGAWNHAIVRNELGHEAFPCEDPISDSVTMSTATVAAQVEQVRSAHALRLLEPKASAGTRTSGSPSVAAADDALELLLAAAALVSEQLLLASPMTFVASLRTRSVGCVSAGKCVYASGSVYTQWVRIGSTPSRYTHSINRFLRVYAPPTA